MAVDQRPVEITLQEIAVEIFKRVGPRNLIVGGAISTLGLFLLSRFTKNSETSNQTIDAVSVDPPKDLSASAAPQVPKFKPLEPELQKQKDLPRISLQEYIDQSTNDFEKGAAIIRDHFQDEVPSNQLKAISELEAGLAFIHNAQTATLIGNPDYEKALHLFENAHYRLQNAVKLVAVNTYSGSISGRVGRAAKQSGSGASTGGGDSIKPPAGGSGGIGSGGGSGNRVGGTNPEEDAPDPFEGFQRFFRYLRQVATTPGTPAHRAIEIARRVAVQSFLDAVVAVFRSVAQSLLKWFYSRVQNRKDNQQAIKVRLESKMSYEIEIGPEQLAEIDPNKLVHAQNFLSSADKFLSRSEHYQVDNLNFFQGSNIMSNSGNHNETDQSRSVSIGRDYIPTNSPMSLGDISGTVTNSINQLPQSNDPERPGIRELLAQLQQAVEDSELSEGDKADLLEEIQTLIEARELPQEKKQSLARRARKIFDATLEKLPDTARLVDATSQLLPMILRLLGIQV